MPAIFNFKLTVNDIFCEVLKPENLTFKQQRPQIIKKTDKKNLTNKQQRPQKI